ncbi:MAG: hypothetical protein A2X64_07465 [Ignavibacteria bacterium GWF2_33_9]|nr:MAG: hypothetical protein A2X64_07465 [Ignavibacteria bacterium GWF2_33_9]
MKIDRIGERIIFSAKKLNFYERIVFRTFFPFGLLMYILIIILQLLTNNYENNVIYAIGVFAGISIIIFWSYFDNVYYLTYMKIEKNDCKIQFYLRNNYREADIILDNILISIEKRTSLRSVIEVIVISDIKKNLLLEIWPDSLLIGKQWRQEDIYELYDILIDYQNKLKEKQTSEQVTT